MRPRPSNFTALREASGSQPDAWFAAIRCAPPDMIQFQPLEVASALSWSKGGGSQTT
jgi:hypothetical protein